MKKLENLILILAITTLVGCASSPQNAASMGSLATESAATSAMGGTVPSVGAGTVAQAASAMMQTPGLADVLVQQLGISQTQAMGGAGSIFSMAQRTMAPDNFGIISKSVPDMNGLLAAAPAMGSSGLGGGSMGTLANMAMLASSFQSLGMGSNMVQQFIPVILQYLQNQGGSTAMNLLQAAILP